MNRKTKGIVAAIMFMLIGMQFVYSFVMTMNQVVPWLRVLSHASEYAPDKFRVERMYYHKNNAPKQSDMWEVVGKVRNNQPARIVKCGLYYPPHTVLNEDDLHALFKEGQSIDVLIRYSLDYDSSTRIINFRQDLPSRSVAIFTRCLLYSYGNLVVTTFFLFGWYWLTKKRNGSLKRN
ncbi:hypothetical protein L4X63_17135 [Geomonas sp. Red32]|uniref:hypothetical protein n=1 Tax=Geomonas sp. Red32 TaxID=2912856 RepID=UPI00202CBE3D|nr:hypothetical protein [Geomonas sp. Red32]MCM0083313.1 hypothetical protein [Geomonas sp. Red32]